MPPLQQILGRQTFDRPDALRLGLAAGFWLFTYLIMTTRAVFADDLPFDLVYPKRILSTGLGALCFWLIARALEARRQRGIASRFRFAAAGASASALLLLAVRLVWEALAPPPAAPIGEDVRWVLTWTGYLLGALGVHQILDLVRMSEAGRESPQASVSPYPANLRVSRNQSILVVPVAQVRWFEADGNYVQVVGPTGSEGWLRSSMRALADDLDPRQFIRLHRSVICARRIVRGVRRRPTGALVALLDDGAELPIGRAHAPAVLAMLGLTETSVPEERRSSPENASA